MMAYGNASGEVIPVSREEQMALYDELPPEWRRLVGALPSPQELRQLVEVRTRFREAGYADATAFQFVVEQMKDKYPGWSYSL